MNRGKLLLNLNAKTLIKDIMLFLVSRYTLIIELFNEGLISHRKKMMLIHIFYCLLWTASFKFIARVLLL